MTDKEKLNAIKAEVQNYIDAAHKAHANITEGNFAHLLSFINSLQEEPVGEYLNIESMIESYKQRLILQANGMKDSPFVNMCLASYKHGVNETLDTLKLSNVQRTVKNWKEEPVNEELESAAKKYGTKKHPMTTIGANESAYDFKAGALWHQNFIWHDANKEEPKIGKAFVTIDSKGVMCAEYRVFKGGLTFKQMKEMDDIVKWAYTEYLIPKD